MLISVVGKPYRWDVSLVSVSRVCSKLFVIGKVNSAFYSVAIMVVYAASLATHTGIKRN